MDTEGMSMKMYERQRLEKTEGQNGKKGHKMTTKGCKTCKR